MVRATASQSASTLSRQCARGSMPPAPVVTKIPSPHMSDHLIHISSELPTLTLPPPVLEKSWLRSDLCYRYVRAIFGSRRPTWEVQPVSAVNLTVSFLHTEPHGAGA